MSRPRLALLNAAHDDADTRRNFRRELDADLVEFDCPAGELPDSVQFDGCVITGSEASVYWDEAWIGDLKTYVGDAVEAGLPMLGVCYGHQLLADVLGGSVEDMGEYEIGYREVRHDGDATLFEGIDEEFTVFTTHSDRVAQLPPGATRIAANDYGIHGFRRDNVFTVQFHPEYDTATAEDVTSGKDLPDERLEHVLDGITEENFQAACEAKTLFENFLGYVRDNPGPETRAQAAADD